VDKISRDICATHLFEKKPTIYFYPQLDAERQVDLKVIKTREKNVVTLDIGAFRAKETILQNCVNGTVYTSKELRSLSPYRATYGYDVLVYVGYGLFVRAVSEQQIIAELAQRNVFISQREIGYLGKKFITYLAIAHQQSRQRLKQAMRLRGGYILHLDGTCEADSPLLFTGIDGLAEIVLDNIKLPSEKAELLIPFFRQIRKHYGVPVALVHDMGQGILRAVKEVFKDVPDFICHFHFLRDIGKDLFGTEYSKIRNRLKKHKIRAVLRKKAKVLEKDIGDDTQAAFKLMAAIDNDPIEPLSLQKMPVIVAYATIQWIFDTSAQLDGYGFPFDCPHMVFYQRLKAAHRLVNAIVASPYNAKDKNNLVFFKLWNPLTKIIEDPQLKSAALQMEKKVQIFKKLRKALFIAMPGGKKGLNDDGQQSNIRSIEQKVKEFRKQIMKDKKLSQKDDYKKMIQQMDKYWDKLFTDPITVHTATGEITIQPQRTNNIVERFFRDFKRRNRRKSGTVSLNKTLKFILADTPLVKNLDNAEYLEIILDGSSNLEERFEKIDSRLVVEKLKDEQKKYERIGPEMKKFIRQSDLPEQLAMLFAARQN
jgi:hypothetical protein